MIVSLSVDASALELDLLLSLKGALFCCCSRTEEGKTGTGLLFSWDHIALLPRDPT